MTVTTSSIALLTIDLSRITWAGENCARRLWSIIGHAWKRERFLVQSVLSSMVLILHENIHIK